MCHRYFINEDTQEDLQELVGRIDPRLDRTRTGDICATRRAPIITGRHPGLMAEEMAWGFSRTGKNLRMINARVENALTKPSWSESVLRRRCVIPAARFYEWDRDKVQVSFWLPKQRTLYMAGFYDIRDNEEQFVILTTEPNESMRRVHDRMPLILPEEEIRDWIFRDDLLEYFLAKPSPELERFQEYEQLSLF